MPYTPYATSSKEKTGDIITFVHFDERNLLPETKNLLSETHDDTESGNKYYYDSNMPTLISEEEMDVISSGDESDDEPMSTEILEDIHDGSQSNLSVNRRETRYNIHDMIKQSQVEWKGVLLSMRNIV